MSGGFIYGIVPISGYSRSHFPLVSADVHYRVLDVQLLATLTQTYTSRAAGDAHVRYVFPLPPDSSVCSFKAILDGQHTIIGVVKGKKEAKADYTLAVSQGKTAALLEQNNVEVFQVSLGNIRSGQTIEVQISYVALISQDGGFDSLRLTFPTAIGPRYGTPDFTLISGNQAKTKKSGLNLTCAIEMTSAIKSITSPSHPIAIQLGTSSEPDSDSSSAEFDPRKAYVSLSIPALLDKDIVVYLTCQDLDRPRCTVESFLLDGAKENTDAYSLTFVPRFDLPPLSTQEYIFLVDRSGSMTGGKILAVRAALQIMLKSLPTRNTLFNIFSFGSNHSSLWPTSQSYSASSVAAASTHVDGMEADYGGTEIRSAIDAAINSSQNGKNSFVSAAHKEGETNPIPTAIFVLTDGESWDLDQVQVRIQLGVEQSKARKSLLRVFTLGIGDAVSKAMCDGIARSGNGTSVFVGESEKPDQKLVALLRAARGAVVDNLSVDWGVDDTPLDDEFELIDSSEKLSSQPASIPSSVSTTVEAQPISLFEATFSPDKAGGNNKLELGPKPIKLPPPPRIQQAPDLHSLPPLYPGFRASVFAIIKRRRGSGTASNPSERVTIRGSVLGRPVALEIPVTSTFQQSNDKQSLKVLHTLAARALIQKFEDGMKKSKTSESEAEVLRLALQYGLASSQTSFVAIDEATKKEHGIREEATATEDEDDYLEYDDSGSAETTRWKVRDLSAPTSSPHQTSSIPPDISLLTVQDHSEGIDYDPFFSVPRRSKLSYLAPGASLPTNAVQPTPARRSMLSSIGSTLFGSSQASKSPTRSIVTTRSTSQDLLQDSLDSLPPASTGFDKSKRRSASARGIPTPPSRSAPSAPLPPPPAMDFALASASIGAETTIALDFQKTAPLKLDVESMAREQSFDGSFHSSPTFLELLCEPKSPAPLPEALASLKCDLALKETIWCTLLCVAFLQARLEGEKEAWAVMVEKAMDYVVSVLGDVGVANEEILAEELKVKAGESFI